MWRLSFPTRTRNKCLCPSRMFLLFRALHLFSFLYPLLKLPILFLKFHHSVLFPSVKKSSYFIVPLLLLVLCKLRKPRHLMICTYLTCGCGCGIASGSSSSVTLQPHLAHLIARLGGGGHSHSISIYHPFSFIQQKGSQAIPCDVLDGFALHM